MTILSAFIKFAFGLTTEKNSFYEQIIASENETVRWTTPLGLPVVQPYQQMETQLVSLP